MLFEDKGFKVILDINIIFMANTMQSSKGFMLCFFACCTQNLIDIKTEWRSNILLKKQFILHFYYNFTFLFCAKHKMQ